MAEAEFVLNVVCMVTFPTMDDEGALPQKKRNEALSYTIRNLQVEECQSIILEKKKNASRLDRKLASKHDICPGTRKSQPKLYRY